MKFVRERIGNMTTNGIAEVFLPVDLDTENKPGPLGRTVKVDVGGERRKLSRRVIEMVREFAYTLDERQKLGHACGAFALACETSDPLRGVNFGPGLGKVAVAQYSTQPPDKLDSEPNLRSGQVAYITNALPGEDAFATATANTHYMVRVTGREAEKPLYASKLGDDGPVVLHGFEDLREFYPFQTTGQASGFHIVSDSERS